VAQNNDSHTASAKEDESRIRVGIWKMCWRCGGKGYLEKQGERIPRSELSPLDRADELVNGGFTYHIIEEECSRCEGTGLRKKFRLSA
jgi:hypothetical protein